MNWWRRLGVRAGGAIAWLPAAVAWCAMAALRAVCGAAPCDFVLGFRVLRPVRTMRRPEEILLGLCYTLTKVEAASFESNSSVV